MTEKITKYYYAISAGSASYLSSSDPIFLRNNANSKKVIENEKGILHDCLLAMN